MLGVVFFFLSFCGGILFCSFVCLLLHTKSSVETPVGLCSEKWLSPIPSSLGSLPGTGPSSSVTKWQASHTRPITHATSRKFTEEIILCSFPPRARDITVLLLFFSIVVKSIDSETRFCVFIITDQMLPSCVTLGLLLNLSESQFSEL